jgi:hypothetical protein
LKKRAASWSGSIGEEKPSGDVEDYSLQNKEKGR